MQSIKTSGGKTVVFFDLETTGLETWRCDIIQLAAISGERTFNVYMMPKIAIDRGAAEVTGFSVRDGALLLQGTAVPTVTLPEALTSFLDFLQSLEQPVLLAAHGARCFDKPVLDRALLRCSLTRQFQQLGSRYLDTFLLNTRGDIIQLAAISGVQTFNVYIMPQSDINIHTSARTGFLVKGGKLIKNFGTVVSTIPLHEALTSFYDFLRSFNRPILLAAHKAQDFALPILKNALIRSYLTQQFHELGPSFLDIYLLSKALYPGLDSYEQEDLLYPFLGKPNNHHNALENVTALQSMYGVWNPNQESGKQDPLKDGIQVFTKTQKTWWCEIIQLAAISGERTFNVYMMPEIAIDRGAAEVTGFSVRDGALLLQGTAVPTVTLTEALTSFLDFLQSLEQPVLLAAHSARRFDKPVLDRALLRCSLTRQFQQLGSRYFDTFLLS
ncbi:unnamed protein product [Gadus morhua 'NCC']